MSSALVIERRESLLQPKTLNVHSRLRRRADEKRLRALAYLGSEEKSPVQTFAYSYLTSDEEVAVWQQSCLDTASRVRKERPRR